MKRPGLVFKIWLAMFFLVLLVLGLSAVFQWGMIDRVYFRQQSERIQARVERFAGEYADRSLSSTDQEVNRLAGELGSSVLIIDRQARVVSWSVNHGMGRMGMGMGMGGGWKRGMGVPFEQADVQTVLAGNTVVRRGNNAYFGIDVLLVAVPIVRGETVEGAVLVHTPLAPIEANIRAINEAVAYSLLLGMAASIVLALIFSRKISGPILKINEVARAMARGDFSRQAPARFSDELGVLAGSINELSGQLREKIQTIDRIDEVRRSFVANISHELRTPLTIMQGYTEALMDGIAEDEGQRDKYLLNIYDETIRLRRLVDDLLDLRRLESGAISLSLERTEIGAIVKDIAGQFKQTMNGKKVRFDIILPDEGLWVRGDPDRLRQVLINLVDNAVRFSPPEGIVEIKGENGSNSVRVSVRDQGAGLSQEEQQLVWERFYKADGARTGRDSGSGLGLAIARQIISLHGGEIGVESAPGAGASFWFSLKKYNPASDH